jgi:hypothetical protein
VTKNCHAPSFTAELTIVGATIVVSRSEFGVVRPFASVWQNRRVGVHAHMAELVASVARGRPCVALVDVTRWTPTKDEFARCLGHISAPEDRVRIMRYHGGHADAHDCRHHTMEDPKCFVLSRLSTQLLLGAKFAALLHGGDAGTMSELPPAAVAEAARNPDITVRTAEGRPVSGPALAGRSWLDVNVSHAGGVVAISALDVPGMVVGCDVMPIELSPRAAVTVTTVREFLAVFQSYFTAAEWVWIRSPLPADIDVDLQVAALSDKTRGEFAGQVGAGSVVAHIFASFVRLKRFLTLWTLKESLIKAMGIGLGFELQRASFLPTRPDVWSHDFYSPSTQVELTLDGRKAADWRFHMLEARDLNVVCAVAVAPVDVTAVSSFGQHFAKERDSAASSPAGALDDEACMFRSFVRVAATDLLAFFDDAA